MATDFWADYPDIQQLTQGNFPVSYLEGTIGVLPEPGDQRPLQACFSKVRPENNTLPFFVDFWELTFRCVLTEDDTLPICPKNFTARQPDPFVNCRCRGDEDLGDTNIVVIGCPVFQLLGGDFLHL